MKPWMPILLGAALIAGCTAPALASSPQYQSDQQMDQQRNTQAYSDGYSQGQADARSHAARNDQVTSSWTKDDDQRAYRQGYDAGYDNIATHGDTAAPVGADVPHGIDQAKHFGYDDGLAAGRHDQLKGQKFKPEDHDLYKNGLHGWTPAIGTKNEFKQLYREAFVKGYEEGFRGTGPH